MPEMTLTLGAFAFTGYAELGAIPRTIQVNTNCLAAEPVQTVAYDSGYMPVTIRGVLQGYESIGESASEHLRRLRTNLKTEVAKDANTLTIDWPDGFSETYRVFKNEDYALVLDDHVSGSFTVPFMLTLNCLPT